MNILYVSSRDPRLTNSGSEQRTNLLWESLKRYGRVYTFQVSLNVGPEGEMIEGTHPIFKFRPDRKSFSLWFLVNSLLSRLSFFSVFRRNTLKIESPEKVFNDVHFDVVVSRYIQPLCDYKYWEIAPLLIDIDDHPYQVFETVYKRNLPSGMKRIGLYITKWQTNIILSKSVGGWIANKEQLKMCGINYAFLPNIPQKPSGKYRVNYSERKNLFTVGLMSYEPNKDGVSYFLKHIWPSFHQKYPDVNYYIIGKGASKVESDSWNCLEGVEYLGYVEDIEIYYEKSLASVVPVYFGGGTCIKTLEAMSYSRACLSTEFGTRGLPEELIAHERGVLVFNDPDSFIKVYEKILDSNQRQNIETQGKNAILRNYSVSNFNNAIDIVIQKVVHK